MHCAVTDALCFFAKDFIVFPNEVNQLHNQAKFFELHFPKVLECIGGTHLPALAPPNDEDLFVNRKKFHSSSLQAICDSDLKFIEVVA